MRREGPQDVLLAPHLSEVEPVRIDVLQPAERALAHQFPQLDERRVVLQQVADHQPPVLALGEAAQLLGLGDGQRQRLLDEDVLAGFESRACELGMQRRRCRDRDAGDVIGRAAPHRIQRPARRTARQAGAPRCGRGRRSRPAHRVRRSCAPGSCPNSRSRSPQPATGRFPSRPVDQCVHWQCSSPMLPQFG